MNRKCTTGPVLVDHHLRPQRDLIVADTILQDQIAWYVYQLAQREEPGIAPRHPRKAQRWLAEYGPYPLDEATIGELVGRARTVRWMLDLPWPRYLGQIPRLRPFEEIAAGYRRAADLLWLSLHAEALAMGIDASWTEQQRHAAESTANEIRSRYADGLAQPADGQEWGLLVGDVDAFEWALGSEWAPLRAVSLRKSQ